MSSLGRAGLSAVSKAYDWIVIDALPPRVRASAPCWRSSVPRAAVRFCQFSTAGRRTVRFSSTESV
jgi:hypothetical protein